MKSLSKQSPREMIVICNNDYPHSVFFGTEEEAQVICDRLTDASIRESETCGKRTIYYHWHKVPVKRSGSY